MGNFKKSKQFILPKKTMLIIIAGRHVVCLNNIGVDMRKDIENIVNAIELKKAQNRYKKGTFSYDENGNFSLDKA